MAVDITVPEGCDTPPSRWTRRVALDDFERVVGSFYPPQAPHVVSARDLALYEQLRADAGERSVVEPFDFKSYGRRHSTVLGLAGGPSARRTIGLCVAHLVEAGLVLKVEPRRSEVVPGRLHLWSPTDEPDAAIDVCGGDPSPRALTGSHPIFSGAGHGGREPTPPRDVGRARAVPDRARAVYDAPAEPNPPGARASERAGSVLEGREIPGQQVRALQSARVDSMEHVVEHVEEPCSMGAAAPAPMGFISLEEVERCLFWGRTLERYRGTAYAPGKQKLVRLVNVLAALPSWGRAATLRWLEAEVKIPPAVQSPCGYAIKALESAVSAASSNELVPPAAADVVAAGRHAAFEPLARFEPNLAVATREASTARQRLRAARTPAPRDDLSERPGQVVEL